MHSGASKRCNHVISIDYTNTKIVGISNEDISIGIHINTIRVI
jgi:hypothetical protein